MKRVGYAVEPGPLLDLFCGIGGLSAGFSNAGWTPVAGIDSDAALVAAYGANFPGSEAIAGDVSDAGLQARLKRDYGPGGLLLPPPRGAGGRGGRGGRGEGPARAGRGEVSRLSAIVGGPPCVGLSDANRKRAVSNPVNRLPLEFARLAASLEPDVIVMEQSKNLKLLKSDRGDSLADRVLKILSDMGYDPRAELLKAEDYGVPQRRKRTIIVAFRREGVGRGAGSSAGADWASVRFPPPETTAGKPVPAGRVLKPPFSGPLLEGRDLETVKMRDAMTKREVGGMEWFPRRAYTSMDLSEPSPTLRTYVHTAAGAFTLHDRARGTYHKMGLPEMLALQTFPSDHRLPEGLTKARVGVGNAVPVKLAEAVARGLLPLSGAPRAGKRGARAG
jgi:DNA-cytosine methyltransferase